MQVMDEPRYARYRLDVRQYHRMAEAGVLAPDARVELIDGEIIEMAPMGTRHYAAVARLSRALTLALSDRAHVNAQLPLHLGLYSEPEPDVSVLKPRDDFYASELPTPADALLVIEVADSTLAYDLRTKAQLYAAHGVANYWVVDLVNSVLHLHEGPAAAGYVNVRKIVRPGPTQLPGLPGVTIDLSGVWPHG